MWASLGAQELTDYNTYRMTVREIVTYSLEAVGIIALFAYFFYKSYYAIPIMSPFIYFFLRIKKKSLGEKRRNELMLQFKETLIAVNGSVQAGYSIENAFLSAYGEMAEFYGRDSYIAKELMVIKRGLDNNSPLAGMLQDLGRRSGISDIRDFAGLLTIGKQSGGNICRIMESYIDVVEEKTGVLLEIDTMVSAKRFEQKIMNVVPFFIIFYVNLTSPGFFDVLYHNAAGIVIMTIALLIYGASVYMSSRIMNIRV